MNRRTTLLAALSITAVALVGCTSKSEAPKSQGPQTTTIEISYDDLLDQKRVDRQVTLRVGDFLQVSLAANASTGFRWAEQMQISDAAVLAQTGHQAVGSADGRPGSPGREVWVRDPREAVRSGFQPSNKYRPETDKAF